MRYVLNTFKVIVIVMAVLFCVFNLEKYELDIIKGYLTVITPKFLPVLIAFCLGCLLTGIYLVKDKIVNGREIKRLRKDLENAKADVQRMQNLPLIDKNTNKELPE